MTYVTLRQILLASVACASSVAFAAGPIASLGPAVVTQIADWGGGLQWISPHGNAGAGQIVLGRCDDAGGLMFIETYTIDFSLHAHVQQSFQANCISDSVAADFDGDGNVDVLYTGYDGMGPLPPQLTFGMSNGSFRALVFQPYNRLIYRNWTGQVGTIDADGDGLPDVAMPYDDNVDTGPTRWGVAILSGRTLGDLVDVDFGGANPGRFVGSIDLNGDGTLDLLFTAKAVLHSGSTWTVVDNAQLGLPDMTTGSAILDYDDNGELDLLATHADGSMNLCLTRNGVLCASSSVIPSGFNRAPFSIAYGDLNHDGVKDFFVESKPNMALVISNGAGDFDTTILPFVTYDSQGLALIADVNGDGLNDLVVSNSSTLQVFPGL